MTQNIDMSDLFETIMRNIPASLVSEEEKNSIINIVAGAAEAEDPVAHVVSGMQGENSTFTNMVGAMFGSSLISHEPNTDSFQGAMEEFEKYAPKAASNFKKAVSSLEEADAKSAGLPTFEVRDMMDALAGNANFSNISSIWGLLDGLGINVESTMKKVFKTLKVENLMSENTIKLSMKNNNIQRMTEAFDKGLDPNGMIGGKFLVSLCSSVEMLDLMIKYGLDLSKNSPLAKVKYDVMIYMVQRYRVDFLDGYEEQEGYHKLLYLNPRVKRLQKGLNRKLRKTDLPEDMITTIVGYIVPGKKLRENDQFVKMVEKALNEKHGWMEL
jgi:hypothetical protein